MPVRSVKVHKNDRPWLTKQLKSLIVRRQALSSKNEILFKIQRNKVNRELKRCRKVYYEKKVKDLCDTKPHNWWRDVKQLCGTAMRTGNDLKTCLHPDLICDEKTLAQNINEVFINTMKDYSSLTDSVQVPIDDDKPISVTEQAVLKKLLAVNISRAGGPDDLSNWVLR